MNLEDSTFLLKNILASELDPTSAKARHWANQLACVSPAEARFSVKLAKALGKFLPLNPIVLLIPRESVPLYTDKQLHKRGVERLAKIGAFQYYATKEVPEIVLFRKKKACYTQPDENAAEIIDIRQGWFELLPYECHFSNGKLVIRAADYLERLRLTTEKDILRIGNPLEWKQTLKKARASLEYETINGFDRVLVIDLLRRNFLKLTPRAEYYFYESDGHVRANTPKCLHNLIISVSKASRYHFCPRKPRSEATKTKTNAFLKAKTQIVQAEKAKALLGSQNLTESRSQIISKD